MIDPRPRSAFKFTQEEYDLYQSGVEIWRDIEGYEGKYVVSTFGAIKGVDRYEINGNHMAFIAGRILAHDINIRGYRRVTLTKDKIHKRFQVHRVVGIAFLNNPENKPEINHDFGDKSENMVWCLSWATSSENKLHAFRTGLKQGHWVGKFGKDHNTSKEVNQFTKSGELIATFSSCKDAEDFTGHNKSLISRNARGEGKSACGFVWVYTKNLVHL